MQTTHSYTRCRFGVATRDVTPPVGIYARSWGAATHDVAEGVHRPFAATAAVFAPIAGDEPTLALVAVDLGWFQHLPDERELRATVLRAHRAGRGRAADQYVAHRCRDVNSSHRQAGSELIEPYIEHLTEQIGAAILEARGALAPAWVTTVAAAARSQRTGTSGTKPHSVRRPATPPVRSRTTRPRRAGSPATRASCAPRCSTTRAIRRRLPGRTGSCRPTTSAPPARCWRAPSALRRCSSRAPRRARPARRLRRRHGRRRPQRPPARPRRRGGDREPAAAGDPLRLHGDRRVGRQPRHLGTPAVRRRAATRKRAAGGARWATSSYGEGGSRGRREPLQRDSRLGPGAGEGAAPPLPQRGARRRPGLLDAGLDVAAGWALLVAVPNEPYSVFQIELRRRFAGTPLLVLGVTNGTLGYLRPRRPTAPGLYQEQQSPFPPGCLEQTIEVAASALEELRDS